MVPGVRTAIQTARQLVVFGLGVQFHDCYEQLTLCLGREADFVCDNAPDKWEKRFFGKRCIAPQELARLGPGTIVVITVRRYEDIYHQLLQLGLAGVFVACFDRGYDVVRDVKRLDHNPSAANSADGERAVHSVHGRWALVTGASRGIGRQIANALAELGVNVVAHARDVRHTADVVSACRGQGVEAEAVAAELANAAAVDGMLDEVERRFPPIDIVFNNAAISIPSAGAPWSISSEDFLAQYAVNAVAPIRICYRLIPPMIRRGFGRIVHLSSTIQRRPTEIAYACSKAALSKFVHDFAPLLTGTGVMMSLVCPGHVRSDMGGPDAPHPVESVLPGALLGALLRSDVNGRWFIAQDYAGLTLPQAIERARFYYDQGG